MGKFHIFCPIQLKFRFWLYKKRWHRSWKFQLEITSNKKVIAKKPLTNLYEMNSNSFSLGHGTDSSYKLIEIEHPSKHWFMFWLYFCFTNVFFRSTLNSHPAKAGPTIYQNSLGPDQMTRTRRPIWSQEVWIWLQDDTFQKTKDVRNL